MSLPSLDGAQLNGNPAQPIVTTTPTVSISLSEVDVFTALRSALLALLPGYEVIQTQSNLVSMPVGPFVAMTPAGATRLATNVDTYLLGVTKAMQNDIRFDVQLDFYGPLSGDAAATVSTILRDSYGLSLFPSTVTPLYADNPVQMPLITGEQTYLQRWKVTCALQYQPVVTAPQQSAVAIQIGLGPIDQTFKP